MTDSRPHWLELDGQVCVVTGAASGIGAAIARSLARAGAKVVLLDRDAAGCQKVAAELVTGGATALAVACDTSSEASVNAAAQRVLAELGPCYALINNAGMLRPGGLADVSLADWNAVLAVNLTGYLLCARAFSAQMRQAGRGSIVNVASISALTPQTNSGAYSASKAGVLLLSRQMAVEWGPFGVRSNAICPGMIRTALSAKFYEEPGFEAKRALVTASRRVGEPQDIADVALFLASPRAAYVNGAELAVDGGMSSMLMDMVPRPGYNVAPTLVTACTALPPEGADANLSDAVGETHV
ncbi:SDR family NAD(P)-dependent oxidoreductase [Rhodoferax ferrireducens]|uniref:SDR family NAD(P)-dependent oxidoreductase n=1 Tax=Rhodoferax ferrireducens TaxID=192843 RepID=UPI000E0CC629|nr:glucose 1-dehydrogenase [Rhodoferax ferrireducens]